MSKFTTEEEQKINSGLKRLEEKVNKQLTLLFEKMNPYMLTHKSDTLKEDIFSTDKMKVLSGFEKNKIS